MASESGIVFYKWLVTNQVFYQSKFTYALVNLKPFVPGHVLVVPLRTSAIHITDLTQEEAQDYMSTLQLIPKLITKVYKADALNIAIQDGPEAGQTVPHLHTHIIPRYKNDAFGGDRIHGELEKADTGAVYEDFERRKQAFRARLDTNSQFAVKDEHRVQLTEEEMKKEADWLRDELAKLL